MTLPLGQQKKIKCWVVYSDEYPGGNIYQDRREALENSEEIRLDGGKAHNDSPIILRACGCPR